MIFEINKEKFRCNEYLKRKTDTFFIAQKEVIQILEHYLKTIQILFTGRKNHSNMKALNKKTIQKLYKQKNAKKLIT